MILAKKEPYQEALPLKLKDLGSFASLVEGDNRFIRILRDAVQNRIFEQYYVFGPQGCGKTLLLNALFGEINDPAHLVFYVDMSCVRALSPMLLAMDPPPITMLDNIDAIAGDDDWEMALFGYYNRYLDGKAGVMITTASVSPDLIPFNRRDLNTRFANGVTFAMQRLRTDDCIRALQVKAKIRGFELGQKTAAYLVRHVNEDMPSLMALLDRLDAASLEERHELTIPFVKKILKLSAPE